MSHIPCRIRSLPDLKIEKEKMKEKKWNYFPCRCVLVEITMLSDLEVRSSNLLVVICCNEIIKKALYTLMRKTFLALGNLSE